MARGVEAASKLRYDDVCERLAELVAVGLERGELPPLAVCASKAGFLSDPASQILIMPSCGELARAIFTHLRSRQWQRQHLSASSIKIARPILCPFAYLVEHISSSRNNKAPNLSSRPRAKSNHIKSATAAHLPNISARSSFISTY